MWMSCGPMSMSLLSVFNTVQQIHDDPHWPSWIVCTFSVWEHNVQYNVDSFHIVFCSHRCRRRCSGGGHCCSSHTRLTCVFQRHRQICHAQSRPKTPCAK
ncbi:hypothetical protein EDB83DRAFT_1894132 [Lactarius deliciosus]|nr:hypothetical protein EDB83DRAFT_1894132 [Lactarius deliciosus]